MGSLLEQTKQERIKKQKKEKTYTFICNVIAPIVLLIVLFGVWELIVVSNNIENWQFPRFSAVVSSVVNEFSDYWPNFLRTFSSIAIGWFFAVIVGIIIAAIIANFNIIGVALTPYLNLLCTLPIVTVVPMMYVFMGVGKKVIIIAIILQSFAIVNLNSITGFLNVPVIRKELMTSLRANRIQMFFRCLLPSALPNIFTGMRLSAIFATTTCISSEFCGSMVGLGAHIIVARQYMRSDQVFGSIFFVAIIGLFFYLGLTLLERLIVTWKE